MERVTAYVSLGSNLGEPERNLSAARTALAARGLLIDAASPVYTAEPQIMREQPWFANQVIQLSWPAEVPAQTLLKHLLETENALGRVRSNDPSMRYGPRIIDLDLLLVGNLVINTPELTLPHPKMLERAFMLVPLLDLAPDLVLPDGRRAADVLRAVDHIVKGLLILQ